MMINQHWFREWFGAVRLQAISGSNIDLHLYHHMASPGHNRANCRQDECTVNSQLVLVYQRHSIWLTGYRKGIVSVLITILPVVLF